MTDAHDCVPKAFRKLRDFWQSYSAADVDWSENAAVPELRSLVHPEDLKVLEGWVEAGSFSTEKLENLKHFLLSQMPAIKAANAKERIASKQNVARAVLPQPYYGDPEQSQIVLVANNPGYDVRMCSDREGGDISGDLKRAVGDQTEHLKRLSGENEYVAPPWATEMKLDDYYRKAIFGSAPKTRKELLTKWLVPIAASSNKASNTREGNELVAQEGTPVDASLYGRALFWADFIPYQSYDKGDQFMAGISMHNDECSWLPSQERLMNLLGALIRDGVNDRLVVFRSQDTFRRVKCYLISKGICTHDDFAQRVTCLSSAQNVALTKTNLKALVPAATRLLA